MRPPLLALLALALTGLPPAPEGDPGGFLIERLPFRIEVSGTYRLTRDFVAPAGVTAIRIAASHVLLDLGGHRLEGAEGSLGGIQGEPGIERVQIQNGHVSLFGGDGIDLSGCRGAVLSFLRVLDNGGHGVVLGDDARLFDCESVFNHGGKGFVLGDGAELRRVRATGSAYGGIQAGERAVLEDCLASRSVYGEGMHLGAQATVRGGSASGNGGIGLRVGRRSFVSRFSASENLAGGIQAGQASVLIECTVEGTLDGHGLGAEKDCALRACRSGRNAGHGFDLEDGTELRACLSLQNRGHGVRAASQVLLRDNQVEANERDGIRVSGRGAILSGNRVRRNQQADLRVEGHGHLVFGNRARPERCHLPEDRPGRNAVGPWMEAALGERHPLANLIERDAPAETR